MLVEDTLFEYQFGLLMVMEGSRYHVQEWGDHDAED